MPARTREQWKSRFQIPGSSDLETLDPEQRNAILDTLQTSGHPYNQLVQNARTLLGRAKDTPAWKQGMDWYGAAHEGGKVDRAANHIGIPRHVLRGMVAAVTPQMRWSGFDSDPERRPNLEQAAKIAAVVKEDPVVDLTPEMLNKARSHPRVGKAIRALGEVPTGRMKLSEVNPTVAANALPWLWRTGTQTSTGENVSKAIRIARGETPDTVLPRTSPKARAFYNQFEKRGNAGTGVIDSWMARALTGDEKGAKLLERAHPRTRKSSLGAAHGRVGEWQKGVGTYPAFQSVMEQIAHENNLRVSDAQAIIWTEAKREDDEKKATARKSTRAERKSATQTMKHTKASGRNDHFAGGVLGGRS